jgi:hypothetical protein
MLLVLWLAWLCCSSCHGLLLSSPAPRHVMLASKADGDTVQVRLCHRDQLHAAIAPPPPLVYRLPVLCGAVCLVVDERGDCHAMLDSCPPLGAPISATGVVDTEVSQEQS